MGGGNVSKKAEVLFFAGTNSQKRSGTIDLPKSIEGKYVVWGFSTGYEQGYLCKDLIPNQVLSNSTGRGESTILKNSLTINTYKQVTIASSSSSGAFTWGTTIIVAGSDKAEVSALAKKYISFYYFTDKT